MVCRPSLEGVLENHLGEWVGGRDTMLLNSQIHLPLLSLASVSEEGQEGCLTKVVHVERLLEIAEELSSRLSPFYAPLYLHPGT